MTQSNLYLPYLMEIEKITVEAPGVRTFRLKFRNEQEAAAFDFRAGQSANTRYSAKGNPRSASLRPLPAKGISNVRSARPDA